MNKNKELAIRTAISVCLFCAVSMGIMLYAAKHKAIRIENVAQDQVVNAEGFSANQNEDIWKTEELRFRQEDENSEFLCIPLLNGIKAENVIIENHYTEKQLLIYIDDISTDFFDKEAIYGDISHITAGVYEGTKKGVLLRFTLSGVYECKSTLEENHLYIQFVAPGDVYDKMIVIDAACGGDDVGYCENGVVEKEITLSIVKRVKELFDNSEIKVYYTRMDDSSILAEERVELANAVQADMMISIRLNHSTDTTYYGTEAYYNVQYFIPGLGNAKLADIVERNVVTEICGKGNGLFACVQEDKLLTDSKIPSVALAVGYVSNKKESDLLGLEDYQNRIAEGIYQAVLEAYE